MNPVESINTGLFNGHEWEAKWISHQYNEQTEQAIHFLAGVDKWIWHPIKSIDDRFKSVILSKIFEIHEVQKIESANLIVTADEKFVLWINDVLVGQSDDKIFSWARPVTAEIKKLLKEGNNQISIKGSNSYVDDPGVLLRLEIKSSSGKVKLIHTDAEWQSSFESEELVVTKVVNTAGEKPYRIPEPTLTFNPAAYFRKAFKSNKKIKQALAYCSALGLYDLQIDDNHISQGKLLPGWSDFSKRVYYNTYDVTSVLKASDEHVINVIVADGYYSGYCGWERGRGYYGKYPSLKMQLMISYEDGSEDIISTDESWTSSEGPIREADILMGEYYDSDYQSYNFNKVKVLSDINPILTPNCADEVKPRQELKAQSIRKTDNADTFIIDFGQNFAGYVRLHLTNAGKRKIILRFSEVLNKDGSLYTDNIRMARAQDTYISKGESEEIWEPLFTYHGFRYVEIIGLDKIDTNTITGISINSLPEQTSTFISSNQKLNKLYECITWNQRSNYVDIPTDCPQRDERFGWTGDAVSYFRTAAFNFDVSGLYNRWFENLFDAQKEDGQLPPFAPLARMGVGPVFFNAAGWADAGIITQFQFYEFYNAPHILAKYYDRMKMFISSLKVQSNNMILPDYGYGDWLCIGEETSKSFIATAYFAYDAFIMNKIAFVLGKSDDAVCYEELFSNIKSSFKKEFIDEDGNLKQLTQTASVLALHFNLLDADEIKMAQTFLIKDIIEKNYHVTTGFLGLSFIMPVLSSMDRRDVAWKVITNNEFPSWFYMIDQGATTLWERWDSYHHEKGFYDPTMNSFNHCSLGCIGEWLFTGIAGINLIDPGFTRILINPFIPEDLDYADASFKSKYGVIKSRWEKQRANLRMYIIIPSNTFAEIIIPGYEYQLMSDHKVLRKENNSTYIEVGSGSYEIICNYKNKITR